MAIDRLALIDQRSRLNIGFAASEARRNQQFPTSHEIPSDLFKPDELAKFQRADALIDETVGSVMEALGVTNYKLVRVFSISKGKGLLRRRDTRVNFRIEVDPDGSPFDSNRRRIGFWFEPRGENGEVGESLLNIPVPQSTSDHPNWMQISKAIELASKPAATRAVWTGVSGRATPENVESLLKLVLGAHIKVPQQASV